jgi:hypothetical protein
MDSLATPHDPAAPAPDSTGSRHGSSVLPRTGETADRPVVSGVPPVSDQPGMGRAARPVEVEDAGVGSLSATRIRSRQERQKARRTRLAA